MRERFGRIVRIALLWASWAVVWPAAAQAATPAVLNVQGVVRDSAGAPADGTFSIRFGLYGAETGGSALWSEIIQAIPVTQGVFTATLGAHVTNPLPPDLFSVQDAVYLGIQVEAEAELPRQRMVSVPYALEAAHSATADSALALTCEGCVTVAELGFDPATQADLADLASQDDLSEAIAALGQTLGQLACSAGDSVVSTGSQWVCADGLASADDLVALQTQLAAMQSDINSLEGTVVALQGGLNGLSATVAALQTVVSGLSTSVTALQSGMAALTTRVVALESGVADLQAQVDGLADQLADLQTALASHNHDAAYVNEGQADSITSGMVVDGTLRNSDVAADAAIAAAKIAGTAATLTGDQNFDAGTLFIHAAQDRVGVGTTSPQARLDVNGDLLVRGAIQTVARAEVLWDSGYMPAPMRAVRDFNLGSANWDFVLGVVRAFHDSAGEVLIPTMAAVSDDVAPAYVALNGTTVRYTAYNDLADFATLGDKANVSLPQGAIRLTAVDRTANYDSGWNACVASQTYNYIHALGSLPTFALLEVSENSSGSGWRVPTMSAANYWSANWRQTAIVALNANDMTVRTQVQLARFRNTATGTTVSPTSAFCRIRLFSWTPDYDSGWVAISTAVDARERWLRHNLGKVPTLFMLYIAQNADGSGWLLPAMGSYMNGDNGTILYGLTDQWAVVKSGSTAVARFVDRNGAGQTPTSGYMRLFAWK